nr:putative ribonuclease H-like domain-containing protein [Tanacetum cinerariifolium]
MDKVEVAIPTQNDKPVRRPVKYAEMYRTQRPRGNQRNYNNLKSYQLGSNFVMYNKACYACGSFNHLQARCKYHQRERMINETNHSRGHSHKQLEDQGYFNSGCSRHMTRNISYLIDFKEFDGGYVAFRRGAKGGKITSKGIIRTVNTACYVHNRVLVVKPHFKIPYELFRGRTHALGFTRPFGCHVTILNTLDHLGKFDEKSDEGFFIGYSTNSKAFKVYNTKTRKVEENLHIKFLENIPIIVGDGPNGLFDIDALIESMNFIPVIAGPSQDYILMPLWNNGSLFDFSSKDSDGDNNNNDGQCKESEIDNQERPNAENNTKDVNTIGSSIHIASSNINTASPTVNTVRQSDDLFGADNDMRCLDGVKVAISIFSTTYPIPTTPNTRIHKDHSLDNVIGDMQSGVQIRRMTVTTDEQRFISAIYEEKTHEDLHTCLFACFLSQEEPKRITNALKDAACVEAMQEELL